MRHFLTDATPKKYGTNITKHQDLPIKHEQGD